MDDRSLAPTTRLGWLGMLVALAGGALLACGAWWDLPRGLAMAGGLAFAVGALVHSASRRK